MKKMHSLRRGALSYVRLAALLEIIGSNGQDRSALSGFLLETVSRCGSKSTSSTAGNRLGDKLFRRNRQGAKSLPVSILPLSRNRWQPALSLRNVDHGVRRREDSLRGGKPRDAAPADLGVRRRCREPAVEQAHRS